MYPSPAWGEGVSELAQMREQVVQPVQTASDNHSSAVDQCSRGMRPACPADNRLAGSHRAAHRRGWNAGRAQARYVFIQRSACKTNSYPSLRTTIRSKPNGSPEEGEGRRPVCGVRFPWLAFFRTTPSPEYYCPLRYFLHAMLSIPPWGNDRATGRNPFAKRGSGPGQAWSDERTGAGSLSAADPKNRISCCPSMGANRQGAW